jgi:hypothetical protein
MPVTLKPEFTPVQPGTLMLLPYNLDLVVDTAAVPNAATVFVVDAALTEELVSSIASPGTASTRDEANESALKPPVFVAPVASVT